MHTLDVSNLYLEYGFNRVLWDACLHCETGEVVGILGRNGGGKSCLMKVIYGELRLKDQYVAIDGKALLTRERRPEDMRYLLQQSFVLPGLSVKQVFDDFGVAFESFVKDFPDFAGTARKRMKAFSTGERRIIEVYGPESSGKTTVALHMVAEVQKRGGIAGFIDAEHALDPVYAKNIGVDIDDLYISQPDNGEQALEITETMVRSGAVDIVIVDSVAALVPKAEIDGEMGDSHVGLQARLMSQALRKLTAIISKSNCIVIFINQLREKVGVMFGNPEVTTGGRALKFYSSVRLDVRRTESLKQSGEVIGNHVRVKVVKNKIAPPFKEAEFDIMFGKGISREGDVLDLAADANIVEKSGSWYAYKGAKFGQGRENAKTYLAQNPLICEEIENQVRELHGLEAQHVAPGEAAAAPAVNEAEEADEK